MGGKKHRPRNDAGDVTSAQSSLGEKVEPQYDELGQPVVEARNGVETRHYYDETGNRWGTEFANSAYRWEYDALGRLLTVAIREGRHADFRYDEAGQLVSDSTRSGSRTTFAYGTLGNPTEVTDPLGRSTHSRYDAAGRLLSTTDALGQTTTYRYGPHGRLLQKQLDDGTTVRYEYDRRGNLTSVDDGRFPVTYVYDEYDRQVEIAYPAISSSGSTAAGSRNTPTIPKINSFR